MPDPLPTSETGLSVRRILLGIAYAAAVVAPLFLLLDPRAVFLRDWPIHVWIIDYYAEYFRQHGDLPTVINLVPAVGVAMPVFYGCLLYPVLGVVAALVGSALTLRVALALMLVIQFVALLSAGRKIFGHRGIAYTVAVSVIWATYSLTNLYNRGAIAEYFATGFYVTALAFGAAAVIAPPGSARRFSGWLTGCFLLLAIGAHPPTAVLAAVFLVLLGLASLVGWRREWWQLTGKDYGLLSGLLILVGLVLAPWLYANLGPGAKLAITLSPGGFHFRPDHCDTFWARFAPFPYDESSVMDGLNTIGVPYLEAPINVVLLGILLWNLELIRRSWRIRTGPATTGGLATGAIVIVAIGWFLFLAAFSLSPGLAACFQFLAPYIQYVYRLVSHCNAALLVAVLASGVLVVRHDGYRRFHHHTQLVLAVGLTVAVLGLFIKLQHAAATEAPDDREIFLTSGQIEIAKAYQVPGLVRELSSAEVRQATNIYFPVNAPGSSFGSVGAVRVRLEHPRWVQTNAMVFPWMKLELDGWVVSTDQLAQVGQLLALHVPAGVHVIRPFWQPDPVWLRLYRISQAAFGLMLVITLAWSAVRLRQLFSLVSVRAADPTP
ncbi:MAG: hypothetical protein ABI222_13290 [Opitutaceae bacterium]